MLVRISLASDIAGGRGGEQVGMIEPPYLRATRAGYDAVAADYSDWVSGDLAAKPLDRVAVTTRGAK